MMNSNATVRHLQVKIRTLIVTFIYVKFIAYDEHFSFHLVLLKTRRKNLVV